MLFYIGPSSKSGFQNPAEFEANHTEWQICTQTNDSKMLACLPLWDKYPMLAL